MSAVAAHPELYDALREAGATESRARAAEQATLPAAQAATKAEVRQKVTDEIRPVEKTLVKVWTAVSILVGLSIATFFFAVSGWLNAKHVADALPHVRTEIAENTRAIAQLQTKVEANGQAITANAASIASNAQAIAENRALIEANAEKLDQLARNQEQILQLLRADKVE